MSARARWTFLAVPAAALLGTSLLAAGCTAAPPPPPSSVGATLDRAVPAAILNLRLVDEHGRPTSLAALSGKVIVLTDFLTSCQEVCPITTGAMLQMRRDTERAGLAGRVVFVEITVDPGRDTPARLAAYARLTGADLDLLTGSPATLAALWRWFGIYYQKVPEGKPLGIDWQTGKPYTYDVVHSDALILIGVGGHERFVTLGMANVGGRLPSALARMLNGNGRHNLADPGQGSWTVAQGLSALSWVLGTTISPGP